MPSLSLMLKPVSSQCNMRCDYCFYFDLADHRERAFHGRMSKEEADLFVQNVFQGLAEGTELILSFQGGEPLLAGLAFYQDLVSKVEVHKGESPVSYAIQTNGLLVDEAWCRYFLENDFLVGLSLDGLASGHDLYRKDPSGKGTYSRVLKAKRLLERHGVKTNILSTLTDQLARHPQKVWRFLIDEKIDHIQFTPCLGPLSGQKAPWTLSPRRFHRFYLDLFQAWKKAVLGRQYVSIKLFDDIVNYFVRKQVTACGMDGKCRVQHVVEADGGLYPCDFYVLDEYKTGSLLDKPLEELESDHQKNPFLQDMGPLNEVCQACPHLHHCKGGCKRMAGVMYVDEDGFCGYRQLLDDIGQELCQLGEWVLTWPRGSDWFS